MSVKTIPIYSTEQTTNNKTRVHLELHIKFCPLPYASAEWMGQDRLLGLFLTDGLHSWNFDVASDLALEG